jgi:ornithine cyclodeaminase/alanine dehydrogenase-like protein (mu-crystallin family)
MTQQDFLHLSEDEVAAHLPPPLESVALARRALIALADRRVQLPPKPTVYPREDGFAHAMPAYMEDGDLLGIKWIASYAGNSAQGLPTIHGVMLLTSAATGMPQAILGAGSLTGARTAAVSGACVEALAPARPGHVAITGAGLQARTHLAVLDALGRDEVVVFARRPDAGALLSAWAVEHTPDVRVTCVGSAAEAIDGAAVVITAVPIGVDNAHIDPVWVRDDALLLPLDYSTSVTADIANDAALYTDDVAGMLAVREAGHSFSGYRDPDGYTGAAIRAPRPDGRVVCQNLGNGIADLVFADYVLRSALEDGSGTSLRR